MKAMVLKGPGELALEKREKPVCGDRDVLVQVKACGISEIDFQFIRKGGKDLHYPRVPGHEIAGVIVEKGQNINVYKVGQKVFIHPGLGCGDCQYCKKGKEHLCDHKEYLGFKQDGGFQDYLLFSEVDISRRRINIINHLALDYNEIALIEPLACCVNMQDLLEIKKDESLLIIGGGRRGYLNFLLAKALGIQNVYLMDENKEQLEWAEKLDFDGIFEDGQQALEYLDRQAGQKRFDVVIVCQRKPAFINAGVKMVKTKGRLGCFDGIFGENEGNYDFTPLDQKEIHFYNSAGCGQSHTRKAQSLLEAEKLSVAELITHRFGLENVREGLENVEKGIGIATIVQL